MLWAKKNFEDNEWKAFDIMPRVSTDSNQKESMKDIPRLFGEIKNGWLNSIKVVLYFIYSVLLFRTMV